WSYTATWETFGPVQVADLGSVHIYMSDKRTATVTGPGVWSAISFGSVVYYYPPSEDDVTVTMRGLRCLGRLTLTDNPSGQTASVLFPGRFDGTMSARWAGLRWTFLGPTVQTVRLGDHVYTAFLGPYVPPPYPTSFNPAPSDYVPGHFFAGL